MDDKTKARIEKEFEYCQRLCWTEKQTLEHISSVTGIQARVISTMIETGELKLDGKPICFQQELIDELCQNAKCRKPAEYQAVKVSGGHKTILCSGCADRLIRGMEIKDVKKI